MTAASRHNQSVRAEPCITLLLEHLARIFNMLQEGNTGALGQATTLVCKLPPAELYYLQSQTYLLCLVLFRRFLRYLRVKRID